MVLKKILIVGLLVIGIAAGAVLLFFAGDHDEGYPDAARSRGETSRVELQPAPSQRGAAPEAATRGSALHGAPALTGRPRAEQTVARWIGISVAAEAHAPAFPSPSNPGDRQ
jgi:hypothetical protein